MVNQPARTLLEQRIRERLLTFEEFVEHAEVFAREHHESGTLSLRHLQRLVTGGQSPATLRPATARLLERLFDEPIAVLLAAPPTSTRNSDTPTAELHPAQLLAEPVQPVGQITTMPIRHPAHASDRTRSQQRIEMYPSFGAASDPPSIAAIRATSSSFQIADRRIGGGLLYGTIARYLKSEIAPNLLDPPPDCSSGEVFSAAASVTEVAGWMAHDSGNDDKAHRHFSQSYHLAVAAENPVLSANVCASLAHLAIQRGQAEDAVRISTVGLPWAAQGEGTEQLVGRLHAMRARGLAIQGEERECRLALDTAREAIRSYEGSTPAGWIAGFDEASLAGEAALCLYSLGMLAEAASEGWRVIELRCCGDRVRSHAFGQLTFANILVESGSIGEAAAIGSEICSAASSLSSTRVHSGLLGLSKRLDANRNVPEVVAFLGNLSSLTREPTAPASQTGWPL